MFSHRGLLARGGWLLAALLCACAPPARAQEALRESLAGEKAAAARKQALENQTYNLKAGPVKLSFDTSLSVELNDNVNLSDVDPQGDLILRPQLGTRLFWPLTEKNALNFSIGLGYAAYMRQTVYDRMFITPDSELAFDLFVRDFRFTFFDRFSYSEDPLGNGAISGVGNYGGLNNTVGLNVLWDLNKAVLSAGYGHANFVSATSLYDYLNRASEQLFTRASFLLNSTTAAGVEATGSQTAYDLSFLNDNTGWSAGVFLDWKLSPHLRFAGHVGYVSYDFQTQGIIGSAGNPNTYYFNLALDHTLNRFLSYSLTAGREVQLGTYSDFQEVFSVHLDTSWKIIKDLSLGTGLFYEHGYYPPVVVYLGPNPTFFFGDTYDRFGAALSLGYRLMKKLDANLGYRLTLKDSAKPNLNYTQNALTLGVTYHF